MKPLIVLLAAFCIASLIFRMTTSLFNFSYSARIAMCVMLCFTGIAHFAFTEGMSLMLPEFVPFRVPLIYFTGALEVILGALLLFPLTEKYGAWLLILLFTILLPANIRASILHLNYQTGTFDGPGINYLWFRIPLQIFFIVWVYLSAIWVQK